MQHSFCGAVWLKFMHQTEKFSPLGRWKLNRHATSPLARTCKNSNWQTVQFNFYFVNGYAWSYSWKCHALVLPYIYACRNAHEPHLCSSFTKYRINGTFLSELKWYVHCKLSVFYFQLFLSAELETSYLVFLWSNFHMNFKCCIPTWCLDSLFDCLGVVCKKTPEFNNNS